MAAPVAVGIVGCGPAGSAPIFETHEDVIAHPGMELYVQLHANDEDGDDLRFDYSNGDLAGIYERTDLRTYGEGNAIFHYVPISADEGDHPFHFVVTDSSGLSDDQTMWVSVVPGGSNEPVFLEPIGAGTTLDRTTCMNLSVVVDDPDSPEVDITQEPPIIEGARLDRQGGHTAYWIWCPSSGQQVAQSSWGLTLGADDGEHALVTKAFLIVLE